MKWLLLLIVCYGLSCCGIAVAQDQQSLTPQDEAAKRARLEPFLSGQGRDHGSLDEGCLPADSVTAQFFAGEIRVRFYGRQTGGYTLYRTENPNLETTPPGAGWSFQDGLNLDAPGPQLLYDLSPTAAYRKYVVTHTCLAPENDEQCDRTVVSNGTYPFSTIGATTDGPDEPGVCSFFSYSQIDNDIWYTYTATCTGPCTISLCGSNYDTKLAVYAPNCPIPAGAMACNDDYCGYQSLVTFNAVSGQNYVLRVGGYAGEFGTGTLTIHQGAANDNCAGAVEIGNGATPFSTLCATTDGPTELFNGSPGQCGQDIWFRYVATGCGQTEFSLCGSSYDTRICVYPDGTCPTSPNTATATNDDDCSLQSRVTTTTVGGQTYLVRVGGFTTHSGTGTLTITPPTPPENDLVCNAIDVGNGDYNFSTVNACTDGPSSGDVHCDADNDVWFVVSVPNCGTLLVSTCNSTFDTEIQVYRSEDCNNLGPAIACNDDTTACPGDTRSLVQFGVEYLTLYYIRVGGYAESGTGQVHVQYTPIFVENDFCYNPIPLSYNVPYNGSNRCAITDGDPTPCGQIYHDLWFTIDPPLNTTTAIGLCNASFDSRIAIYHTLTGCGPSLEVICDDNSCANGNDAVVTFFRPAIDDGGYVVRIGGATLSDEGTFTMNPIHN